MQTTAKHQPRASRAQHKPSRFVRAPAICAAVASSSYTLSRPLQPPRYASSARRGLSALNGRHSPSTRLQTTTRTKGLRSVVVAATSYQHEAAKHGDNGGIAATSALRLVAGDDEAAAKLMRAAARVRGGAGASRSPKGRPGAPREGSGGKVHAAPPALLRLPKEGAGGQGGSIH